MIELSNRMSDLATWHPRHNIDTGSIAPAQEG